MAEITYCDDYEAITGKKIPTAETKVIEAPEQPAVPPVVDVAPATVAEVPAVPPVQVA
jgi:hypothetical protein